MLYLERHELHLRTFPQGKISHTIISHQDAKKRIDQAIATDEFYGSFNHDNLNPKRADKKFTAFIEIMDSHCGIKLPIEKFFNETLSDEGDKLSFGNPAGLAILKKGDFLLVVDYCYSMPENSERHSGLDTLLNMPISPDTIQFHLFEMLEIVT